MNVHVLNLLKDSYVPQFNKIFIPLVYLCFWFCIRIRLYLELIALLETGLLYQDSTKRSKQLILTFNESHLGRSWFVIIATQSDRNHCLLVQLQERRLNFKQGCWKLYISADGLSVFLCSKIATLLFSTDTASSCLSSSFKKYEIDFEAVICSTIFR